MSSVGTSKGVVKFAVTYQFQLVSPSCSPTIFRKSWGILVLRCNLLDECCKIDCRSLSSLFLSQSLVSHAKANQVV
ncbi:hypothetical protein H5410_024310 [Solanum commersonii]|uniref:Uncharacterized protein n=1 Tax=Solanum commersonii TaxID=4109 RepID=A0A9J5ZLK7_SOLCO|nr:hypothetical protein H5410_024310 [Solanum commersonii]